VSMTLRRPKKKGGGGKKNKVPVATPVYARDDEEDQNSDEDAYEVFVFSFQTSLNCMLIRCLKSRESTL
jgi:hypothetical protein